MAKSSNLNASNTPYIGRFNLIFILLFTYSSFLNATDSQHIFNVNSLTFQQGEHYKVTDNKQQITTLEHLSVWVWGDVFFFYDHLNERNTKHSGYYYELSPRLSLSAITGNNLKFGPVSDLLLAATFERGSDGFNAKLFGAGINWDVAGFNHLSSNIYYRDTEGISDETWQLTVVWDVPFSFGEFDLVFDGYTDIRGGEGSNKGDINFNPQLKLDIGKFIGFSNHLYTGIEYSYWNNKFGINDVDERNVSGLLKFQVSF